MKLFVFGIRVKSASRNKQLGCDLGQRLGCLLPQRPNKSLEITSQVAVRGDRFDNVWSNTVG